MREPAYLRRPLGLLALFLALALGGVFSWPRLPVELLPRLPFPRLTVLTVYENAPPQEVEALVTRRLEGVLGTVAGLRRMESSSREGLSVISLVFDWGRGLSEAAAESREKLDSVSDQLPREAELPLVLHYDPSESPVITLALTGPDQGTRPRILASTVVKSRLETLEGVAAVRVTGGQVPEVEVLADRARLVAHNLDLGRVVEGIRQANQNVPAGQVTTRGLEVAVRTVGRFKDYQEVASAPLTSGQEGRPVLVGDVARAVYGSKDPTGFCRVRGQPAVLVGVLKEPAANTVEVSARVRGALEHLASRLPGGFQLTVVDDQAPFVESSLGELQSMVWWGGLLAFGVLVAFMRRPGRALLLVSAVPLSLLATLGFMHLGGRGLNLMSIGGLALGVGMLVDSGIVVLEAMHRHQAQGLGRLDAAARSLAEVRSSLISATLTTVAVLVPVLFMTGLAQRLFNDFAFTLVAALLVSLATALYLLPALVARGRDRGTPALDQGTGRLAEIYGRGLDWVLGHVWLTVLVSLAVSLLAGWLLLGRGAALLPEVSGGRLLVQLSLPPEVSLATLSHAVDQAEWRLLAQPEVEEVVTRAGVDPGDTAGGGLELGRPNEAVLVVRIKPEAWGRRQSTELMERFRRELAQVAGVTAGVQPAGNLTDPGREGFKPPQLLRILGEDLGRLDQLAGQVRERLAKLPMLGDVGVDGVTEVPQLEVKVDRAKAAAWGITVSKAAQGLKRAVAGEVAGELLEGDREVDIRVRLEPRDRANPNQLALIPLLSSEGGMVSLGDVARMSTGRGPEEIIRQDRRRAAVVRGQVLTGAFSQGEAAAMHAAAQVPLPAGYELAPGVAQVALTESLTGLLGALGLALLLIYVILVVQFESLVWPLVILLALPPVACGPALALWLADMPLTALVLLGGVVLMGMAVNTSILLVDYTNQLRGQGLTPRQALAQAGRVRLRPILMSTLTTVMGALPLCLAWGGAGPLGLPLALTVVTGLTVSLAASLFLAPALYLALSGLGKAGLARERRQ
ncbi:MAG: efflux RND transporter permease subunit [Deltaproteobacteria bacterium]|nr:efflux RND transporter permease subunit [Deltaproteobacteria bacterium]